MRKKMMVKKLLRFFIEIPWYAQVLIVLYVIEWVWVLGWAARDIVKAIL